VTAYTDVSEVSVPVPSVVVVDTVGAGDAFAAGFLAWWVSRSCSREDLIDPRTLREATVAAVEVAIATCTGQGAHPAGLSHPRRSI
jgi:fructokinase